MQLRSDFQGRLFNEVLSARVTAEQRFNLATQRIVSDAGRGEKRLALARVAFKGRVIKLLDALPAFRRHSLSSYRVHAIARIWPIANCEFPLREMRLIAGAEDYTAPGNPFPGPSTTGKISPPL